MLAFHEGAKLEIAALYAFCEFYAYESSTLDKFLADLDYAPRFESNADDTFHMLIMTTASDTCQLRMIAFFDDDLAMTSTPLLSTDNMPFEPLAFDASRR